MSLQQFIEDYKRAKPDDVLEINDEVSVEYEPTCYANELRANNSLLMFNKINGYEGARLANNVFGKKERIAFSLGSTEDNLYDKWNEIINSKGSVPISASDGQVKEIIYRGSSVDLFRLPVPKHYLEDGGRYISGGLIVARNPVDNNILNLSFARIQLLERDKVALSMHSRGHLWNYYLLSKKAGKSLPISVIIGAHPIYYMAAAARIEDEYSKVGCIISPKLTDGITNDIPVPADSEIVFEGEISSTESFHEGPFSEYTGYISNRSTNNLARVKSLFMRRNPIFLDINPSNAKEHIMLSSLVKEAPIIQGVKEFMPANEYNLEWPIASSHYMAIGSVKRPEPGLAKQLGLILLGLDHYLKIVIISEGDGGLSFKDLMVRLARSSNRATSVDIIRSVFCNRLDPSADQDGTSSKAILVIKDEGKSALDPGDSENPLVLSHTYREDGWVNIILDNDINASNEEEIIWALATRLQPSDGIKIVNNRIVIDSRRPNLLRPSMPEEVVLKVRAKLRSSKASS